MVPARVRRPNVGIGDGRSERADPIWDVDLQGGLLLSRFPRKTGPTVRRRSWHAASAVSLGQGLRGGLRLLLRVVEVRGIAFRRLERGIGRCR